MTRTQIQLPDALYHQAKSLAEKREISLAELVRRGLEYILAVSAPPNSLDANEWQLPQAMRLGKIDPFNDPDWRMNLQMQKDAVAETRASYGKVSRTARGRRS